MDPWRVPSVWSKGLDICKITLLHRWARHDFPQAQRICAMDDSALEFNRWRIEISIRGVWRRMLALHLIILSDTSSTVYAEALGIDDLTAVMSSDQVPLVSCTSSFTSGVLLQRGKHQNVRRGGRLLLWAHCLPLNILAEMKSSSKIIKPETGRTAWFC